MAEQDIVEPTNGIKNQEHVNEEVDGSSTALEEKSPAPAEDESEYISGFKLAAVVASCTMAGFLMLLDTSIVATAIPRITTQFHSLHDIGWYGTAYQLANSAFQPLTGRIYNQFYSKWTFIVFLGIFELGSLLCGVAVSSKMLIVGRAVAGVGGAGLLNGGLTIIRACVPAEKSAAYLGMLMGCIQLGILLGPLIGGALTQYTTWRWCFYINLPPGGLVALAIALAPIPDRRTKSQIKHGLHEILKSFDLPGFALFAGAAIMFLLAIEWGGNTYSWNSSTVIGLFCGSGVTLIVFIFWEAKRGDAAMIPLSIVKQRIVWSSCVNYFFFNANLLVTPFYMAIYFQAVRGVSPTLSGVYLLPAVISQVILAMVSGVLVTRLGYYLPWAVAASAFAAIGTGLLSTLKPHSSTVKWVFYQIIAAGGRGCGLQMPIVAVQNILPPETVGLGMAAVVFSQGFGPALFLSFAETLFTSSLKDKIPKLAPGVSAQAVIDVGASGFRKIVPEASLAGVIQAYDDSFRNVFYLITGAALAAFIAAFGMGWRSVKKPAPKAPGEAAEAVV
ncbi:major facilitator superfamily-domain-containing protein [Xylogone sp. PMI_703]|nr:major facilitator superfamily-domain-containing protein [Xylogone sp. PMI_703]